MIYRTLGKSGIKIPVIGLGTWQFGGEWGKDYTAQEVVEIMAAAKSVGINFIDTAECYGDHLSEKLIGEAIHNERDKWIIATKFGHKYNKFQDRTVASSPADVTAQLEASLRALQTDHVDLYLFHSLNDEAFNNQEMWTVLQNHQKAGKIRVLGISVSHMDNPGQVKRATEVGASVIEIAYNRIWKIAEKESLPECQRQNLGVLARVPLASGYLTGKFNPNSTFAANDVRSLNGQKGVEQHVKLVEEIRNEVPAGVPMAHWAMAWCLKHPAVHAVLPGCKNPAQVIDNARAAELLER
ncbi:MAG: aldo/keto reductase [Spirochaetes bacterium]|nr:aldo/keto reductase [Spirochaetota bacterium]